MTESNHSPKSTKSKKNQKDISKDNYVLLDITKSTEENLERIINKDLSNNSKNITRKNLIYELLIKLKYFKEFLMFYNIEEKIILEMLSTGILKPYKKDEQIFKKYTYPEYYFLILTGSITFPNMPNEFLPGTFFGEKNLINNSKYRIIPFSNKDNTILLLIPKEFFLLHLKNKIITGNDNIRQMIFNSFKIFTTIERKAYDKYYQKMNKIFPSFGEIIISNKDIANSIYLIYEGSCVLNSEKEGDLVILQKGDIFGNESLSNFDERGRMLKNKYIYNIINKSQSTIIFKFSITDLNRYILNGMKTYLEQYFLKREEIIKKYYVKKRGIKNTFKKEYDIFKRPIQKELIKNYNVLTSDKLEKSFNNVLSEIRLNRKGFNLKRRLLSNRSNIDKNKNMGNDLILKYLQRFKYKSPFSSQAKFTTINSYKSNSNINLDISPRKKVRRATFFSERRRKMNKKRHKSNSIIFNNIYNMPSSNNNISSKMLTISDNNNSNIYLTSINQNNKNINVPDNSKDKVINSPFRQISGREKTITDASNQKNANKRLITSAFSTNRCSTSYKNNSNLMSVREQIEAYGFTILDTMSYFNDGRKNLHSAIQRNNSANNKIIKNTNNIFYQTKKFNMPLYVLCDLNEKKKFPKITNFIL